MPINSKSKGNRAERELAMLLGYMTGVRWYRVPCSGSLFTNGRQSEYRGDVYCNDEHYNDIVIECKHYKVPVRVLDLFNPKSDFNGWVAQLRSESKGCDGFLFFKNNGHWFWLRSGKGRGGVSLNFRFFSLVQRYSIRKYTFGMLDLNPTKVRKSKQYLNLLSDNHD